jgi:Rap1a immunity proteins
LHVPFEQGANRKLLAIIVTALIICDGSATAEEFKTGNELLDDCTISQSLDYHTAAPSPERVASAFYCIAYIAGVNDAFNITAGGKSCIPTGVTHGQLRNVILR